MTLREEDNNTIVGNKRTRKKSKKFKKLKKFKNLNNHKFSNSYFHIDATTKAVQIEIYENAPIVQVVNAKNKDKDHARSPNSVVKETRTKIKTERRTAEIVTVDHDRGIRKRRNITVTASKEKTRIAVIKSQRSIRKNIRRTDHDPEIKMSKQSIDI